MRLKDVLNLKIGNEEFEIVNGGDLSYSKIQCINNSGVGLSNCYLKCSNAKRSIYREWLEWACENDCIKNFGISSYNCMMFTLTTTYDKTNIDNIIYITPSHNNFIIDNGKWQTLKSLVWDLKKEFKKVLNQYDNKRITFKSCIDNEIPFFLNKYEPLLKNVLGGIDNNICDRVIKTLYNEYIR